MIIIIAIIISIDNNNNNNNNNIHNNSQLLAEEAPARLRRPQGGGRGREVPVHEAPVGAEASVVAVHGHELAQDVQRGPHLSGPPGGARWGARPRPGRGAGGAGGTSPGHPCLRT